MVDYVTKLRKVRDQAKRVGLPVCDAKRSNVEEVCRAVNDYVRQYAHYTEDKDVNWQKVRPYTPAWEDEMWASWAYNLVKDQELNDDCDAYAWTSLMLCLALGVPPARLAFLVVRSETSRRNNSYAYDHAIGSFLDDAGILRTLGDTWDQARVASCVPIGHRHDVVYAMRLETGRFEKNKAWWDQFKTNALPHEKDKKGAPVQSRVPGRPLALLPGRAEVGAR